jgi:hypothetical protein
VTTSQTKTHKWEFKPRFRRNAFGWQSQPAVTRVKQAVAEIKKVANTDPALAADGAVEFIERLSPALHNVDGSSGALGSAVHNAIADVVPILSKAPVDEATRDSWEAYEATLVAVERRGNVLEAKRRITETLAAGGPGAKLVSKALGARLALA